MRIAVAGGTGMVGRYVVDAAERGGHDVVLVSRSHGVDLRTGHGLQAALEGVNAIVDVTNPGAGDAASEFFAAVAAQLQSAAAAHHVGHIVTLSIVGIERAPDNPYYAAKLRQEQIALGGSVPATILRATQFHEFAVQMLRRTRRDGEAHVRTMRVRSVAARTTGEVLTELAVQAEPALGRAPDLGGPEEADLVALARRFVERFGLQVRVLPEAADGTVPLGATLPGPGARLEGPTFDAWLESDDAARMVSGLM